MTNDWTSFQTGTIDAAARRCQASDGWTLTLRARSFAQGLVEVSCQRPGERVLFDAWHVDRLSSAHVEEALDRRGETGSSEVWLAFPARTEVPPLVREMARHLGVELHRLREA